MSPPSAFGFGMALFPLQVKNLTIFVACLNMIIASSLSAQGSILALGLVLVIFAIPVHAIIGVYTAVPHRGSAMLGPCKHGRGTIAARSRSCCASGSERSSW
jgi:hypothetical protein